MKHIWQVFTVEQHDESYVVVRTRWTDTGAGTGVVIAAHVDEDSAKRDAQSRQRTYDEVRHSLV